MKPIATWWLQLTEGVNYYRARMPAKYLPGRCASLDDTAKHNIFVRVDRPGEEPSFRFPQQKGNCAVWMFSGATARGLVMREQQNNGTRVLMEVDDNYMVPPPNPDLSDWSVLADGTKSASYERHRQIVPWCDGVIVSTPHLASVYREFNDNVYICPNSIDPDDWKDLPLREPKMNRKLRVGWAASDSHWKDVEVVGGALEWLGRRDDVEIVIMGIDPERFRYLNFPFSYVHWADSLAEYRKNLTLLDVALCPLREGEWEDCKSDVKALEATMAGAAVIVSRVEAYRPWWETDRPCLVADPTPAGFIKSLRHLLDNKDQIGVLAKDAREYVLSERSIEQSIGCWHEAIRSEALVA